MVVKRQCSFCAGEVEPGTGTMFVKRDGTVFFFCSSSCRKQQLHLGRVGHRLKWTRAHILKRAQEHARATPSRPALAGPRRGSDRAAPPTTPAGAPAAAKAAPTADEAKPPARPSRPPKKTPTETSEGPSKPRRTRSPREKAPPAKKDEPKTDGPSAP
jgi:large subunit ribosomal protein L24e